MSLDNFPTIGLFWELTSLWLLRTFLSYACAQGELGPYRFVFKVTWHKGYKGF